MSVRLVVVTYNSADHLRGFLDSVTGASTEALAVTVSDNGSSDHTLEIALAHDDVQVLSNPRNLGYGGAANAGLAGAEEDWFVVANPDVRLGPGSIDTLLAAAERWPSAGALGPAILTEEGALYPSARMLPSLRRGIGHATLGWIWPGNPWSTAYRNDRGVPTEGPVGWLSGSFLVLRRQAFESVGGFDEDYFMYFEDVDLCDRMGQAGFASVYVPSAEVVHSGGHSTTRDPESADRMARAHHRSAHRYLSRRHPGPLWAPVRGVVGVGLAARYLLSRRVSKVSHASVPTRSLDPEADR